MNVILIPKCYVIALTSFFGRNFGKFLPYEVKNIIHMKSDFNLRFKSSSGIADLWWPCLIKNVGLLSLPGLERPVTKP